MDYDQFSTDVLKAQDGRRVPLTFENGGPVIGEALFRYDENTDSLVVSGRIDKDKVAAWLLTTAKPKEE